MLGGDRRLQRLGSGWWVMICNAQAGTGAPSSARGSGLGQGWLQHGAPELGARSPVGGRRSAHIDSGKSVAFSARGAERA